MSIEWPLKGPFNTNLHLQRVSVATEDFSDSVVELNATSNGYDQPAHRRILIRAFATRLNIL